MVGRFPGPHRPTSVEGFIKHQRQIPGLEQSNGCGCSLDDRCNVFVEHLVHHLTNFAKCPGSVAEFPKQAVHLVQWSSYLFWCPEDLCKPAFNSPKLFWNSQDDHPAAHASEAWVFVDIAHPCPPHRCSARVLAGEWMVLKPCQRFHEATSKFNPCPHKKRQHCCRSEKSDGPGCLNACRKVSQVPCPDTACSNDHPERVPCRRVGGHTVGFSQGPIKVLLAVILPLLLGPSCGDAALRNRRSSHDFLVGAEGFGRRGFLFDSGDLLRRRGG